MSVCCAECVCSVVSVCVALRVRVAKPLLVYIATGHRLLLGVKFSLEEMGSVAFQKSSFDSKLEALTHNPAL